MRARILAFAALALAACPSPRMDPDADAVSPIDAAMDTSPDVAAPDDVPPDVRPPPPARHFITDAQGRALVLHGANVDSRAKTEPMRSPTLSEADVQRMANTWGFNFVRYLVLWDAAEPTPGTIDQTYFDRIQQRLDWFAANHIYVMLDMHQDVYATRFCCDGAPAWAIRDDGLPFTLQPVWSLNYFEPAVIRAFDNFWSYTDPNRDLQDHYGNVWVALATRFGNHPAVIGYDLMNEPSPGSLWDALEAARGIGAGPASRSAQFDRTRLGPFYQRMIDRIRTVDRDRWIFVEPRYGAAGNGAVQYFPVFTDPRAGENRVAFAPHMYSIAYEANSRYEPATDHSVQRWEAARGEETRTQNWPILMGEFGMDQTFPGGVQYLDDLLQMSDHLMISWAYWSWDPGTWGFWEPTTMTENPNIQQLVRVFPQRIAGTPTGWSWDRTTRVFTLTFDTAAGVTGATEIFVPADRFFTGGYRVEVSDPAGTWTQTWDAARQLLSITTSATVATHTVTIRPM